MYCPICDQKPMNCDCTPRERAMWLELQELEDRPVVVLTDAEREAVLAMACHCDTRSGLEWVRLSAALRGLLERTK